MTSTGELMKLYDEEDANSVKENEKKKGEK